MPLQSVRAIQLMDFDKKVATAGQLTFLYFTTLERTLRAAKFFAIFLGLAFASVFVPALHFVLVPLFSLAAVACAAVYFLQKQEVAKAQGPCPYCSKPTLLKRANMDLEFRDSCEHCLQLIMVTSTGG